MVEILTGIHIFLVNSINYKAAFLLYFKIDFIPYFNWTDFCDNFWANCVIEVIYLIFQFW